jgi:hypothetical protein
VALSVADTQCWIATLIGSMFRVGPRSRTSGTQPLIRLVYVICPSQVMVPVSGWGRTDRRSPPSAGSLDSPAGQAVCALPARSR